VVFYTQILVFFILVFFKWVSISRDYFSWWQCFSFNETSACKRIPIWPQVM